MSSDVIAILGLISALVCTILVCILVLPEKKRPSLNGFFKSLHDIFNFKQLLIEKILKFCYVFSTLYCLTTGFFMLFMVEKSYSYSYFGSSYVEKEWVGYYGLLVMLLGPIFVRIIFEVSMMFILLVKNVIQINNKLKNQNENAPEMPAFTPKAPVNQPVVNESAPANNARVCVQCGNVLDDADIFCKACGTRNAN